MANVLGRMEDLEGKAIQEFSLCQQASHRLETPSSLRLKELRDRVKLRNLIGSESNVLLEFVDGPVELLASICLVELL